MSSLGKRWKNFLGGIIAGAADNDPAGITTYTLAAALTGYSQLWLMILAIPMLIAVQSMAAKIGDVTCLGLAAVFKNNFPKPIVIFICFIVSIVTLLTISADLIAVSLAIEIFTGIATKYLLLPIALLIWLLFLFADFEQMTKFLLYILIVYFAYIIAAFKAPTPWAIVLKDLFVPSISFNHDFLFSAVGILGATFTPALFFWQTKEEVEEKGTRKKTKLKKSRTFLAPGFIFAQIITIFIMISSANVFFAKSHQIKTPVDVALALQPLAGSAAKYLFAAGILGSGLMALPVMSASIGYLFAETFGWRHSLSWGITKTPRFYLVITLSLFLGVEIALLNFNPLNLMFYSQLLGSFVTPLLLILILILSNKSSIMGKYKNSFFDNFFGLVSLMIMLVSSIAFILAL